MKDFQQKLESAVQSGHTIVFSARCTVDYKGRAEAHLPEGERLIIIKGDRSVLVHQPLGSSPVNYMKAGTSVKVVKNADSILVILSHDALREYLELQLFDIGFFDSRKLNDGRKIELAGDERGMSDWLFENPDNIEQGFRPFSREEQTKYGFLDLFGTDKDSTLTIVECKRYSVDLAAVTQLRRYVERVKADVQKPVRGILVAPKISPNAERMLRDWGFSFKSVQPPLRLDRSKSQSDLFQY